MVLVQATLAVVYLEHLAGNLGWGAFYAEDSDLYLLLAHHFNGTLDQLVLEPGARAWIRYREFNPLITLLVVGIHRSLPVAVSFEGIFFLLNMTFYLASAGLFYDTARRILDSRREGLAAAVTFATALPVIIWELPVMLEAAAFFFAALNTHLYVRLRERETQGRSTDYRRLVPRLGLFLAGAILVKPTLLVLALFWGLFLLGPVPAGATSPGGGAAIDGLGVRGVPGQLCRLGPYPR